MADERGQSPDSTAPMPRPDSTAPVPRPDSTAPVPRPDSTAPMLRSDSTAPVPRADETASTPRDATRMMPPAADEPERWAARAAVPPPGSAPVRGYEYEEYRDY